MSLAVDAGRHRNVNDLPLETLELVLIKVRGSSQLNGDRSFVNALTVCSRWKAVGEKVLWTDVSVSETSLDNFCQSTSTAMSMTRTFTLNVTLDTGGWSVHDRNWANSSVVQQIWQFLERVPSVIGKMYGLESFSFTIAARDPDSWSAGIRRRDLRAIVDALPLTLQHLELHTNCAWDRRDAQPSLDHALADASYHICPSIRRLLPNLRNLRLRVCELCEDIIPSAPSNIGPINASSKGALIINGASYTKHCRDPEPSLHVIRTFEDLRSERVSVFRRLGSAIRTAVNDGLLDGFGHCTIISACHVNPEAELEKPLPGSEFTTVFESRLYPIPRQIKHPVYFIGKVWCVVRWRRSNGEEMELIEPGQDHLYLERDSWKTVDGFRVATSYMECRPRFRRPRGTIQILHLEADRFDRCEVPGFPCQLRVLERKVGKWLLRPVETEDLNDFELVRLDHYHEGQDSFGGFDYIDNQDNDSQNGGDQDWQEDGPPDQEEEEAERDEHQADAGSDWEL